MPIEIDPKKNLTSSAKFAIIVSRYNINITGRLKEGAVECLAENGVNDEDIQIFWVPGAWELSLIAKQLASKNEYDGIICLGAVIKGETTHDEHINRQVSLSLGQLSLDHDVPIAFGLLTCNTMEQAIHRAGGNVGNKGVECAEAALEMVNLIRQMNAN